MPSPAQLGKIHALRRALGLDEDVYRAILERYGAASAKDLDGKRLQGFVDELEDKAVAAGVWKHRTAETPPGRATKAQVRAIRKLWKLYAKDASPKALAAWLKKYWKCERLEWMATETASKAIAALNKMADA